MNSSAAKCKNDQRCSITDPIQTRFLQQQKTPKTQKTLKKQARVHNKLRFLNSPKALSGETTLTYVQFVIPYFF